LLLGAVAVLILLLVIFWKKAQINQEILTLQPRLGELENQLTYAQSLAELDPITARSEARAVLRGLEDLIATNSNKTQAIKRLKQNYQQAQTFLDNMAGSETTGPLEPVFDLRLAEADFVAQGIVLNDEALFALDAAGQKIVVLDLKNKQTEQINLDKTGSAKAITVDGQTIYLLADGLHSFLLAGDSHSHTKLKDQGDSDRDGTLLQNFATYLYVFNPSARNIYRYLENDEGLSDPIGWLVDKQGLEFETVESMAIDGDLWLTTRSGKIHKYTQGQPETFGVSDLPIAFDSSLKIATHADSPYLYVLERARQRLVILSKDGSFFKEVISESLATADAIATSLTEDAVWVVSGSLVYKISL
jgi:hypothetical protein